MRYKGKRVGVLMGGISKEREISLLTGEAIYKALLNLGYNVIKLDLKEDIVRSILEANIDVAFIALHGRFGEDGTVQSLLELLRIPYTGSSPLASAMSMNKIITKKILLYHKIPTPEFVSVDNTISIDQIIPQIPFSFPFVVKPSSEGSTIGVSKVYTEEELKKAIREAFSYDDQILIEKMIEGKEITVGILNGEPLPIIEIAPKSGFYDYRSKYTKGMTEYIIPPNIAPSSYEKASNYAFLTYKRMRLNGCARVDMMMDKKGEPFVLEINSMPGMTSTSLIPKAASYKGISFEDLVEKILNTASLKIKV